MSQLDRAIVTATLAHEGQVDKQGAPYILHPLRVMLAMPPVERLRIAAVLHDTVEDTGLTLATIRAHFGDAVADIVDAVSRRPGEVYLTEFIPRAARHPDARLVKRADIEDNLGRLPRDLSGLERRYVRALTMLESLASAPASDESQEAPIRE